MFSSHYFFSLLKYHISTFYSLLIYKGAKRFVTILASVSTKWVSLVSFECRYFVADCDFKLASLVIQCYVEMQW